MKFVEIQSGVLSPVSNEENVVLEMVKGYEGPYPKAKMGQREREIARQLVHRGFLTRVVREDKLYYLPNVLADIWEK
jgi:hypothetical protein